MRLDFDRILLVSSLATVLTAVGCTSPGAPERSRQASAEADTARDGNGDPARATADASPPAASTARAELTPELAGLLATIRDHDRGQLAVSEEDGRFLRLLVAATGRRRALEIGGASGYSAIWMGLALRETGGRLVTIEYDPVRATELAANVRRAGLSDVVTVVAGDAFAEIPKLSGTFDFVFLDAWKRDYQRFFDLVFPRLDPGGLFVGHNVVNKKDELGDFLATIEQHPSLLTSIVSPSGEGISISFRRR
jgi:predicted O-methyltransferase YrrM